MNNYRHLPYLAASFAAVLLAAGCATRPSASPITLLAPSEGAVVPTLGDGQKAYLALPRAERVKKFADPKYRAKMRSLGYYPKPLKLAWTNAAPSEAPSAYAVKVVRLTDKTVVFTTFSIPRPAAARIAFAFVSDCRVCASVPSGKAPVAGSMGSCPDTNTSPPASTACEYGPIAFGACSVDTTFFKMILLSSGRRPMRRHSSGRYASSSAGLITDGMLQVPSPSF